MLVSLSLLCGGLYTSTASAADAAADDTSCVHVQTPRPLGSPAPGPVHSK
ncbi:hypothetical protein [Hydrocarboniphaga sp.]